jgi:hypothetical protein
MAPSAIWLLDTKVPIPIGYPISSEKNYNRSLDLLI